MKVDGRSVTMTIAHVMWRLCAMTRAIYHKSTLPSTGIFAKMTSILTAESDLKDT